MKIMNYMIILARVLISRLDLDSRIQIVIFIILISLILGSSILADILLEQLLQADGVIRLSSPKEMI